MKTAKRLFSLFLLLAMVASLFSGVAYASEEFDAPDVMEPVTEEVTEDPVPEEVAEEEAPLTSGDEALVPVEEEAPAEKEAPVSDALPEEAEEANEEEGAPAEDGEQKSISYRYPVYVDNDAKKGIDHWEETSATATKVTDTDTTWTNGWYYVEGTVAISNTVTVTGDVKLILCDKAELTVTGNDECAGICVSGDGNSLTIYGQSGGTGKLEATGGDCGAGIGGGYGGSGSNITINGGEITATGSEYGGAGIGGGCDNDDGNGGDGSNITINGGTVTAKGGVNAAGIGGGNGFNGYNGGNGNGSNITINGGTVEATGGDCGAGIGGGCDGDASDITINGGTVIANGGDHGAGIGGGGDGEKQGNGSSITINGGTVTAKSESSGAGIGGGSRGNGSSITINGGEVTATCSNYGGAGIGGGYEGYGNYITINGGTVTATGGTDASGIGAGSDGSASNITVATSLVVKAGDTENPTTVITDAASDGLANDLAGKRYVTIELPDYTLVLKDGFAYKNEATSGYEVTLAGLTYNSTEGEWTMNNFNFATAAATAIQIEDTTATINLSGSNTVTGGDITNVDTYGICASGNLTISGTGSLNVTAGDIPDSDDDKLSFGIFADKNIVITGGCSVTATGGNVEKGSSFGIGSSGDLTVSGATVSATGGTSDDESYGIVLEGGMMVSGDSSTNVIAKGKKSYVSGGIQTGGKVSVSGGTAYATGDDDVLDDSFGFVTGDTISVTGTGKIVAKGGDYAFYTKSAPDAIAKVTDTDTVLTFYGTGDTYKDGDTVATSVTLTPAAATVTSSGATTGYETLAEAWEAAQDAGTATVKLLANVTGNVTVESDDVITLDLNGYVLQGDGKSSVITNNGTLTIKDSNTGSQTHSFTVGADGLWTLDETSGTETVTGGVITGGNGTIVDSGTCGGGVYNTGKLSLVGGNIIGNTVNRYGGGVYNTGTFDMSGGSITGNKSTYTGGGVNNGNTFNMSGGSITDNTAQNGGGVDNGGTFNMSGGGITDNTAQYGGGVYNGGTFDMSGGSITGNTAQNGGGVNNGNTFNMSGGSITGNTATTGGGVNDDGKLSLVGGSITGNTATLGGGVVFIGQSPTIGGTVKITGNTSGNLYILDGMTVAIGTGTNGVAEPAAGMCIGVTMDGGTGKFTSNGTADDVQYFFSDAGYMVQKNANSDFLELATYTASTTEKFAASLTLTDNIAINIYIREGYDTTKTYTMVANGQNCEFEGGKASLTNLNATDISRDIRFVVYKDDVIVGQFDYSVAKYCNNMLKQSDASGIEHLDKLQPLCNAILDYGEAAQVYCGMKTTATYKYQTTPDCSGNTDAKPTCAENEENSVQLSAHNAIDMRLRLKDSKYKTSGCYLLTYCIGEDYYRVEDIQVEEVEGEDGVRITVPDICPTQFGGTFKLYYSATAFTGNEELSELTGEILTFTVKGYLVALSGLEGASTALKTFCGTLYNYGTAAKAYADSLKGV